MFQLKTLNKPLRHLSVAGLLAFSALHLGVSPAVAASKQPLTADITIGDVYAELGSITAVPVTYKGGQALSKSISSSGVASYGMQLDYDTKELSVVSILPTYGNSDKTLCVQAAEGCFQSAIDEDTGTIRVAWVDLSGGSHVLPTNQQLFQIFIKPKGQTGTQSLKVTDKDNPELFSFTDENLQPVNASLTEGKIVISSPSDSSPTPVMPNTENVKIVIDGKEQEQSATQKTTVVGSKTVTTVSVDNAKVIEQFEKNNQKTLLIPTTSKASVVTGELNGKLVKTMENKDAVIQLQTEKAVYTLPAAQIKIDQLSEQIGKSVALQDITIKVSISASGAEKEEQAHQIAKKENLSLVVSPVDFEVEASYGDQKIQIDQFNRYVDRFISLPEGIDPSKITTGVVLQPDGTFTHVPTKVTQKDNKYYAEINAMTNSTYSVIWNPKSFQDVADHWSRETVNNLASRLVVSGSGAAGFEPDRAVTRAEFTSILLRALGLHKELAGTQSSFTDISSGDWYGQTVRTAASYELISGYEDGSFHPSAPITREEAMVILSRASELTSLNVNINNDTVSTGFMDESQLQSWARSAASQVIQLGLIEGYNGSIYPQKNITRAETAAMVYKLLVNAKLINAK